MVYYYYIMSSDDSINVLQEMSADPTLEDLEHLATENPASTAVSGTPEGSVREKSSLRSPVRSDEALNADREPSAPPNRGQEAILGT